MYQCSCHKDLVNGFGAIVKARPEITYKTDRTYDNGKKAPNGIEIRFGSSKPTEEVRAMLKEHGFRFSEKQKMWYAFDTAKTKAFAEKLADMDVDVDDTQYEKLHFWARVKNYAEYQRFYNHTEFFVKADQPQNFYSKSKLEKAYPNVQALISKGILSFKKFYNKAVDEDNSETPETPSSQSKEQSNHIGVAEKLKDIADGMQKQIDAKLHSAISKQRPTARRMRIAAGMREDGYRMQEIQSILYALSQAHKTGTINDYPFLKQVRNKAGAELINQYGNGTKHHWDMQRQLDSNKEALQKLGINNVFEWSLADTQKGEVLYKYSPAQVKKQTENERKVKELEMEVIGRKIPGFFPTPVPLIERMIELADIEKEHSILEPSAGKGDILDTIKALYPDANLKLYACEVHSTLREILKLKDYSLIAADFLELNTPKFDRIVMNPPFENGQDIDHVTHALKLLKPGGRLVSIMGEGTFFRQFKKDSAFRELLKEKNAYVSEPLDEAFKNAFNSTGVRVRIVAINVDGSSVEPIERQKQEPDEEMEILELEAEAELELLKMRVELQRKKKGNAVSGITKINPAKLNRLKQKAWSMKNEWEVLNYK